MAAQGVWSADLANEVPLWVRFRPLGKFCNLLRLSLQDYVSNGTRTSRMLSVLLVSDDFLLGSSQLWCFCQRES